MSVATGLKIACRQPLDRLNHSRQAAGVRTQEKHRVT